MQQIQIRKYWLVGLDEIICVIGIDGSAKDSHSGQAMYYELKKWRRRRVKWILLQN